MNTDFQIIDLDSHNHFLSEQCALVLQMAFAGTTTSWQTLPECQQEVAELLEGDNLLRVALKSQNQVLGWIGGLFEYNGRVCELDPLAVHPHYQGGGVGKALVADLEYQAACRGAVTMLLGTDDEDGRTNLGGQDLYPDVLDKLKNIQNVGVRRHPFGFYQKCGYSLVGVIPDANGAGKPDLLMAKKLTPLDRG